MTSTPAATPPGDADDGGPLPLPGQHGVPVWEPLAPGALGADPSAGDGNDGLVGDALVDEVLALPLTRLLADALGAARRGLDDAQVAAGYPASLGPAQRLEALQQVAAARHVADAVLLRLLASFTREEVRDLGATSLVDLVITHTGASPGRASTETVLAAALGAPPATPATREDTCGVGDSADPGEATGSAAPPPAGSWPCAGTSAVALGLLGAAHAAGDVSTDVAALAQRTVADLPARIRRAHGAVADAVLAEALPGLTHPQARLVCSTLASRLDPDHGDRGFDPDDIDRRRASLTVHDDGVGRPARPPGPPGRRRPQSRPGPPVHTRPHGGRPLAPHNSEHGTDSTSTSSTSSGGSADATSDSGSVHAASDSGGLGGGAGEGGGAAVAVRDPRTAPQRRADALAALARHSTGPGGSSGGDTAARVIVNTTTAQLAGDPGAEQATCQTTGRPLTRTHLLHLACSGILHAVKMSCEGPGAAVLSWGRAVRLFTATQRRAMLARDGGCAIPGCTAPPGWLEAHHVHDWASGGPTDVDSGVLLCTRHHVLVTLGIWQIRMVNGAPQVRPPRSVDPHQRWLLNPRRALHHHTTRHVEQLLDRPAPRGPTHHPTDITTHVDPGSRVDEPGPRVRRHHPPRHSAPAVRRLDLLGHARWRTAGCHAGSVRRMMSFGYDDDDLGDRLLAAVLSGHKTATSSLAVEYLTGDPLPRVGEQLTLVDHQGRAHGVVETTRVTIVPLSAVGDDVAHDEGEGFADAAHWRRDHVTFWQEVTHLVRADAGDPHWRLRDHEPVVVEWFRLLEPVRGVDDPA